MNKNEDPYKRRPGDFEIRILRDGRVVFVAPDEELAEIAKRLNDGTLTLQTQKEVPDHVGNETNGRE
jgi:hypothetical protein